MENQKNPEKVATPGNLGETVDRLCREKGWPTVAEQREYWQHKERQQSIQVRALDAFGVFMDDIGAAMGKLKVTLQKLSDEIKP